MGAPQWPEMGLATSRYDPGKLTLLLHMFYPFWPEHAYPRLPQFWAQRQAPRSTHQPTSVAQDIATRIPCMLFWCSLGAASNRAPLPTHSPTHIQRKIATTKGKKNLNQSGSSRARWNPSTKGYKTKLQSPEMVQATSRYDPVKVTLLHEN